MLSLDLDAPWWLLALPLALLPLLPRRRDLISYPWVDWLPGDASGRWIHLAWQLSAVLCIASLVVSLGKPGRSESDVEILGRGAELSIVMDRSASMDSDIRRAPPQPGDVPEATKNKNEIARGALTWLLQQRPDNRYALTVFNLGAMRVTKFTDNVDIVQAGLDATAVGRGPNKTDIGRAVLSAIEGFEDRQYTGSRAIILVSDGGARLDEDQQRQIQQGLERNQISLYFIYIQSGINPPNFELVGTNVDELSDEVALHAFFTSLGQEYQVFLAHDAESMAEAITTIDEQQNLPLRYFEKLPRVDYQPYWLAASLLFGVLLLLSSAFRLEGQR